MDLKLLHPLFRTSGTDTSAQMSGSSMSASQLVEILRTSPYGVVRLAVPKVYHYTFSLAYYTLHFSFYFKMPPPLEAARF
jgi:hypothetical protein